MSFINVHLLQNSKSITTPLTAQNGTTFQEIRVNPKEWGRLVESSVGGHLINYSISERYNLYY